MMKSKVMVQEDSERFFPLVTEISKSEYSGIVSNVETTTHTYQVCNLVTHNCDRASCENFAYMMEKIYGGATKLYRSTAGQPMKLTYQSGLDCPVRYNRVQLQYTVSKDPILETVGVVTMIGASVGIASRHFHKKRKWTIADAGLAAAIVAGGAIVVYA